jgi:hypothetical protein
MKHSQLAAQLSTVRDDLLNASAFADTIKRLSAIGYPAVELIPSETVSDKEIARICEEAGVKIASAHVLDNCSLKDQEIVAKMQAISTLSTDCPSVSASAWSMMPLLVVDVGRAVLPGERHGVGPRAHGDDAPSAPQRGPGHSHQPHRPDADHHDHLAERDLHPFHAREARGDHVVDHHGLNADGIRDFGKIEVSIELLTSAENEPPFVGSSEKYRLLLW